MSVRTIIVLLLFSLSAIAQKPETRWLHEMIYDEANGQVLMFGGANENKVFKDLWALKNFEWKKLSDSGPSGGIKSAFAYDANRKCAVLFGGSGDGNKPLGETWEWNGKTWKQINIPGPPARIHSMGAFDPKHKVIIIFGGIDSSGLLSDTWEYDGTAWKQKDANGPKNCIPHGIFYDEQRESVTLITLYSGPNHADSLHSKNEMWAWTGNSWKKLSSNVPSTSLNALQALAPFGKGEIILFDGDDISGNNGKTWKFSQGSWAGKSVPGPSPRVGHGMAFDKSRNRTILFGGSNRKKVFNDLWEWNGKQWNEIE